MIFPELDRGIWSRHCPNTPKTKKTPAAVFPEILASVFTRRQRRREVVGVGKGLAEPFALGEPGQVAAEHLALAEPIA